ncbi:FeoB small GTPase domain-containing protein [Spirochaeta africana]|nr:FeoB small GTPase domain-containing protein [Spirochaeta africana]
MGMPNVGKSVLFGKLTGLNVAAANFAGTTVEYTAGTATFGGQHCELQDVPGTYSLQAGNQAEQVAVQMLNDTPDAVIVVLDALNLEAGLALLLQIQRFGIPTIAAVNRIDLVDPDTINLEHLERHLHGIRCVAVSAVSGQGLATLRQVTAEQLTYNAPSRNKEPELEDFDPWPAAEAAAADALGGSDGHSHTSVRRTWDHRLVAPMPGIPIALAVMAAVFTVVIGAGMGFRRFVLLPLLRGALFPAITTWISALPLPDAATAILIGDYGVLIKGIEWPFALVFPYVISFYAAFALLEDSGYLPRLAALLDGIFRRLGIGGSSVIPLLLGYGCGIPAIMATRALPSRKQRLIVTWLVCLSVPCVSQTGAFIALLAEYSLGLLGLVFLISIAVMITAGLLLDSLLPGASPGIVLELPPLLPPNGRIIGKKIWMRAHSYLYDGAAPMIVAILAAAVLYELGILYWIGTAMEPLVTRLLLLPSEASVPLLMGIVRRELTVLPLLDMQLSTIQLLTGSVVALLYIPCIAMVVTVARELGIKIAIAVLAGTTLTAFAGGTVVAQLGGILLH